VAQQPPPLGVGSVTLPDEIYEQIQQIAQSSKQSVETILQENIGWFYDPVLMLEEHNLDHLVESIKSYPNAVLWFIVDNKIMRMHLVRLRELNERADYEPLTEPERVEQEFLLGLYDSYLLVRSQALAVLKQRGEDIETNLMTVPC
jgi:hypothetical protein